MINKTRGLCLAFVCLFAFLASGCVETAMMYQGNSVSSAMSIVPLQKGDNNDGTWQTFDLTIDYRYMHNGTILELSGQAVLSDHYQMNYNGITKLFVYLFFLDENSRVLETAHLVRAMTGSVDEILTFSQQYVVPAGTTSISFGYDGTAREYRDITSFYELPLNKK